MRKGRKKTYKNKFKTTNIMAIRTYILIITLDVSRVIAPNKDIDWLNGYKHKTSIYAVYKRPMSDLQTHTTESEVMEKGIPYKWESKER